MAFSSVVEEHLEAVEVVFAQRLASGEPAQRQRALRLLRQYIAEQCAAPSETVANDGQTTQKSSKKNKRKNNASLSISGGSRGMSVESLGRLAKGLHYVLWMQDKPVLQEELADNITGLTGAFGNDQQVIDFVRVMFETLSKEWPLIDRWRMDKFLMLVRRFFRVIFGRLAESLWDAVRLEPFLQLLRFFLDSESTLFPSIKYHCVAVLLDELDAAGGVDENTLLKFLNIFFELDAYFQTICSELFDAILHDFSEQLVAAEEEGENVEEDGEEQGEQLEEDKRNPPTPSGEGGIRFDYAKIADSLFQVGKRPELAAKRRKRLYALSRKFDGASKGQDPYPGPDEHDLRKLVKAARKTKKRRIVF